jgi:AcrR family transcriptional regulator
MSLQTLSPTRQTRRLRILEAAEHVFRAEGFRGTSMERIADIAGISKVTLYGYFADKEAVFEGVAQHFAIQLRAGFEAALSGKGPTAEKVANALAGKHLAVFDTVRSTIRPQELFAARDRIAAAIYDDLDQDLIEMLAAVLRSDGIAEPDQMAQLLFAASQGIANGARTATTTETNIRLIVQALLRP